jgi:hypothetical protein
MSQDSKPSLPRYDSFQKRNFFTDKPEEQERIESETALWWGNFQLEFEP